MAASLLCLSLLCGLLFQCTLILGECINQSENERNQCSDVKETDLVFRLFNHDIKHSLKISSVDTIEDLMLALRPKVPAVFITHGWLKNENHVSVSEVRKGYLDTRDVNVIAVGWGSISQDNYITVSSRVPGIGHLVGKMIIKLLNARIIQADGTHLLGHSLGAHIFGVAGRMIRNSYLRKISRITGFDPAGPGYNHFMREDDCLDKKDAQFVDVIHTCIKVFGYTEPSGHVDFYPNGGFCNQPGCHLSGGMFCGHGRSWKYFVESLYHENNFPAVECDSERNYKNKYCRNRTIVLMGIATPNRTRTCQESVGSLFMMSDGKIPESRTKLLAFMTYTRFLRKVWMKSKEIAETQDVSLKSSTAQIQNLKMQVASLKSLLNSDERIMTSSVREINSLKSLLSALQEEYTNVKAEKEKLEGNFENLSNELSNTLTEVRNGHNNYILAKSEALAFEAQLEKEREKIAQLRKNNRSLLSKIELD